MKFIQFTFSIIFIFFCTNTMLISQSDCSRSTDFGDLDLCLPIIKGYHESYSISNVKVLADATEVSTNVVLGYYLNDATYFRVDSLGTTTFDDYFKIYATKEIMNIPISDEMIPELMTMMSATFETKNWDELKPRLDEIDLAVEFGSPTNIKSYQLNDDSFSYVLLMTYNSEGLDPYTVAMSINGLLLKNRLIWLAYYLSFEDEGTLIKLEKNTNEILSAILNANPK